MTQALKDNWKGHDNLKQLCVNGVPKYGNDDDYADEWAAWIMDTWHDSIDWINTQKDIVAQLGRQVRRCDYHWVKYVAFGHVVGSLPNGHVYPNPLADTMSPCTGHG